MSRSIHVTLWSLVLSVSLTLASCGGAAGGGGSAGASPSPSPSASPSPTAQETPEGGGTIVLASGDRANDYGVATVQGGTIEVSVDDYFFAPTILEAKAGATVTIEFVNESGAIHNFSIPSRGIDVDIDPHATTTVEVTFPKKKPLTFECGYHLPQDMRGELRVA